MKTSYTTVEVAKEIGVNKSTLLRWLYAGKLAEPEQQLTVGAIENRIWSEADLDRARAFKAEHYKKRS